MYSQYISKHETEIGPIEIDRVYRKLDGKNVLDSVLVVIKDTGRILELPKSMWQTDTTIIRKVCSIVKSERH